MDSIRFVRNKIEYNNIYLIGPMGAGKTSLGKQLALLTGKTFYDLDREIEKEAGLDIPGIFENLGEPVFRDYEARELKRLCQNKNIILATGGGAILKEENRACLSQTGIVIFLQVSADTQMHRINQNKQSRPLLKKYDSSEKLAQLTQQRDPFYRAIADFFYSTDDEIISILAQKIMIDIHKISTAPPIYLGENLLQDATLLRSLICAKQVMIVSNPTVARWYLQPLQEIYSDLQCDYYLMPDGEQYKNINEWQKILNALAEKNHHRDTTVIALGGGVVGDTAGFAAACYQRGVRFIQIPTSLLAQVDASIGGKTGVNHPAGKNLIGAFYQPSAVIIDINTLSTLPQREYHAGIAEIIKAALICDADLFCMLEKNLPQFLSRNPECLQTIITRACAIKKKIVTVDEKETGSKRALLNLGHTFAHAIEQTLEYKDWLHGEAVAVGLLAAARLSEIKGLLSNSDTERIRKLLIAAHLPTRLPEHIRIDAILTAMQLDKKILNQQLRFILLQEIGHAIISADVNLQEVRSVLNELSFKQH